MNLKQVSYSDYLLAEDYGHNILVTLPFRSVYVLELRGSLGAFETAYLTKVKGLRPDYRTADTTATVFTTRSEYKDFHRLPPQEQMRKAMDAEMSALKGNQPCLYNFESGLPKSLGMTMVNEGMLYRAMRGGEKKRDSLAIYAAYRSRRLDEDWSADEWASQTKVQYHLFYGLALWQSDRKEEARVELELAGTAAAGRWTLLGQMAESCLSIGDWAGGAKYYAEALEVLPPEVAGSEEFHYDVGGMWLNLAIAREQTGDRAGARQAIEMVQRISPELLERMKAQK
jgi:hypothetical protein